MSEITYKKETVDGTPISMLTQEGFSGVRAFVALPFKTEPFTEEDMPHELPHVMEHVICSGDGAITPGRYRARTQEFGGFSNAYTVFSVNGLLRFETQQPETSLDIVTAMFRAIRNPYYDQELFADEQKIVRNELLRDTNNPAMMRDERRFLAWGREYRTTESGLASIDDCSPEIAKVFFDNIVNKPNIRVALTGSEKNVSRMKQGFLEIFSDLERGDRVLSASHRQHSQPDYYEPAVELPEGQTFYSVTRSADVQTSIVSPVLRQLVRNCVADFVLNGEMGLHDQSRQRGLSYGMQGSISLCEDQWNIFIHDTVSSENVPKEIALLEKRLAELQDYSLADFETKRRKILGNFLLYPDSLLTIANGLESMLGPGMEDEFFLPSEFLAEVSEADPKVVINAIHQIAAGFLSPNSQSRYSYGTNPFV